MSHALKAVRGESGAIGGQLGATGRAVPTDLRVQLRIPGRGHKMDIEPRALGFFAQMSTRTENRKLSTRVRFDVVKP